MSTLQMTAGEARTIKFVVNLESGTPAVSAMFVDIDPRDLETLSVVTEAEGLAKYDPSGRLYRQGTPSTTIVSKAAADFKECGPDMVRSKGFVLVQFTAPLANGVYVFELTGTNTSEDVWKDRSTLIIVSAGAGIAAASSTGTVLSTSGKAADAELLDGHDSTYYAAADHVHDFTSTVLSSPGYTIQKIADTYYAKDLATGTVLFSGTDFSTVFNDLSASIGNDFVTEGKAGKIILPLSALKAHSTVKIYPGVIVEGQGPTSSNLAGNLAGTVIDSYITDGTPTVKLVSPTHGADFYGGLVGVNVTSSTCSATCGPAVQIGDSVVFGDGTTYGQTITITQQGTPGTSWCKYYVSAVRNDGTEKLLARMAWTNTAASALDGTNYNVISWDLPADPTITAIKVWRTEYRNDPGFSGMIGLIATLAASATSYNDQGAAATESISYYLYDGVVLRDLSLHHHQTGIYIPSRVEFQSMDNITIQRMREYAVYNEGLLICSNSGTWNLGLCPLGFYNHNSIGLRMDIMQVSNMGYAQPLGMRFALHLGGEYGFYDVMYGEGTQYRDVHCHVGYNSFRLGQLSNGADITANSLVEQSGSTLNAYNANLTTATATTLRLVRSGGTDMLIRDEAGNACLKIVQTSTSPVSCKLYIMSGGSWVEIT